MAAFFSTQLDFIFFFYGLAFILLGITCVSISRSERQSEPWAVLGLFAYIHGTGEWLDLSALIVGDTPVFAVIRTAVMTGSFIFLMEFARLEAIRFGLRMPGRWLYVALVFLVVLAGISGGLNVAGAVARYVIGLVGALGTSLVFARYAAKSSGAARRFAIFTTVGFALYGLAAGVIVGSASFWPASVVNYDWFSDLTGTPIQLVRGILACWISYSVWSIWGHRLVLQVSSGRYTAYLRRQVTWTLIAMAAILTFGWLLTDLLGGFYKLNIQEEARSDIDLLASRFSGETATIDGMVKALAGSPSVLPLLVGANRQDETRAQSVLNLNVEASGAKLGLILDISGTVVASSDPRAAVLLQNHGSSLYFQSALAGGAGHHFAFDAANSRQDYYASYPVRAADGKTVGVAVLKKALDAFEADLRRFDRPYFFIDPNGVVVMTNRTGMQLRTLWPLSAEKKSMLARQFGRLNDRPLMKQEFVDATWTMINGERDYVRRRFANHSQWSLVILKPTQEIFASRILGIIITLLITIMTLIYLFGRERWFHDTIQMENRLRLQELTRDLSYQATTDSLTGLNNRLKFDQALANEMLRSDRYETPLSLVLCDIDHFKRVNDTHGHLVGDKVLVHLSQAIQGLIRKTDLVARWGGEEFVILTPGLDGPMAYQAADKLRNAIGNIVFDEVGTVTCSFGVAQYMGGDSTGSFVSRADRALYRAKMSGRNLVKLASQQAKAKSGLASVA